MTRVLGKNLFPNTTFPMDMSALMTGMRLRQDVSELSSSLPELLAPPPPVSGTSQPSLPTGTPSLVPSWARKNVHNNHNIIYFYCGPAQLTTDPCSLFVSNNQFAVASKKRKVIFFCFSAIITSDRTYFADLFVLYLLVFLSTQPLSTKKV